MFGSGRQHAIYSPRKFIRVACLTHRLLLWVRVNSEPGKLSAWLYFGLVFNISTTTTTTIYTALLTHSLLLSEKKNLCICLALPVIRSESGKSCREPEQFVLLLKNTLLLYRRDINFALSFYSYFTITILTKLTYKYNRDFSWVGFRSLLAWRNKERELLSQESLMLSTPAKKTYSSNFTWLFTSSPLPPTQ